MSLLKRSPRAPQGPVVDLAQLRTERDAIEAELAEIGDGAEKELGALRSRLSSLSAQIEDGLATVELLEARDETRRALNRREDHLAELRRNREDRLEQIRQQLKQAVRSRYLEATVEHVARIHEALVVAEERCVELEALRQGIGEEYGVEVDDALLAIVRRRLEVALPASEAPHELPAEELRNLVAQKTVRPWLQAPDTAR